MLLNSCHNPSALRLPRRSLGEGGSLVTGFVITSRSRMPRPEELSQLVFHVRGENVMFDADVAKLYGVSTKALNQAMTRNKARFPADFAFRLSRQEFDTLRSQIVTTFHRGSDIRSPNVTHLGVTSAHLRTPLPSKAWRCSRSFCAVPARSR